jgi:hydroxypyruvate isomerase
MQRTEGDLVATLDAYWPLISHIQIADVPGRHEPGTGEINYPFVLDHLESRGYQGAVALEYHPSTARTEDSLAWLRDYQVARAG